MVGVPFQIHQKKVCMHTEEPALSVDTPVQAGRENHTDSIAGVLRFPEGRQIRDYHVRRIVISLVDTQHYGTKNDDDYRLIIIMIILLLLRLFLAIILIYKLNIRSQILHMLATTPVQLGIIQTPVLFRRFDMLFLLQMARQQGFA